MKHHVKVLWKTGRILDITIIEFGGSSELKGSECQPKKKLYLGCVIKIPGPR